VQWIARTLVASILAATTLALGCHTAPITERPAIAVPAGLSGADVQFAILRELLGTKANELTPGAEITDRALEAVLAGYRSVSRRRAGWYPESVEPGVVHAGFESRAFYLGVAIHHSASSVQVAIVESRNLDQANGTIHRNALVWTDQLETRIRRALGEMATIRALEASAKRD
jgi:hypothetical protein